MQTALLVEDIRDSRRALPGTSPQCLKTEGPKTNQLWAALEGVGPVLLYEFFTGVRLYVMVSHLSLYCRGEREAMDP